MLEALANNKEAMASLRLILENSVNEYILRTVKEGKDTNGFLIGYKMIDIAVHKIVSEYGTNKKFDNK
jgi:hypothetical protein